MVASFEGQYFKKYGKSIVFSEQEIVDCTYANPLPISSNWQRLPVGHNGCNAGSLTDGFDYIKYRIGMNTFASYPVRIYFGVKVSTLVFYFKK